MHSLISDRQACLERVMVADLRVGMQVSELDRPWLGTPFVFHGFRIKSADEIELLQRCCDYVYVNTGLAGADARRSGAGLDREPDGRSAVMAAAERGDYSTRYRDTASLEEELARARKIFLRCHEVISDVFEAAEAGDPVDLADVHAMADAVVGSVLQNPDAFMLLPGMQNGDPYRYRHAVNCCVLAAVFCRGLGFDREEIQGIAMGAMLLDIGMVRLPSEMLEMEAPLSPLLQKLTRHHVNFGLDIVTTARGVPAVVSEMIRTHHERVDGRGYPAGLRGEQIPVCGRIAAIVDCYDAMVNVRPYRDSMTPAAAVTELYKWRDVDFNSDLVEKFIRIAGVWPSGSLVELNTGQLGIVMAQHREYPRHPQVMVVMGADRVRYAKPRTLDLREHCRKTGGRVLDIMGAVKPADVNFDPVEYRLK